MSLKTVIVNTTTCVRCGGFAGPEVIPGDTVKLWLDQESVPSYPEWVEGTIVFVEPQALTSTAPRYYTIQYDSEALDNPASALRDCDILSVTCIGCCAIINEYLLLLKGINIPHVSLSYSWNSDGDFELQAHAYSTQIAGLPGEQVEIASYVFTDPDAVILPYVDDIDGRVVAFTDPEGEDWPGGLYTVTVTDALGLVNTASVFVAPRPRFRWETVTMLVDTSTIAVVLAPDEAIISVMASRSDGGFYQFAPTLADPAVIEASTAPTDGDLDLQVLIHTP